MIRMEGYDGGELALAVSEGFIENVTQKTGLNIKNGYCCAKILALMEFFSHRSEFSNRDLVKVTDIGHNNVTKYIKAMEAAGILVIDRSEWVTSSFTSPYEYRIKDSCDSNVGGTVYFNYDLTGTVFAETLYIFGSSRMSEVVTPEGNGWDDKCLPSWCYTSPYYRLSYRFGSDESSMRLYECDSAARLVARFGQAPVYKSGRIYHPFHNVPRALRHNIEFEGSPITELYDLHASFFTLLCSLLRDKLPVEEFEDLFDTCFSGRFYTEIADAAGLTKEAAKDAMQGWRNVCNKGVLHSRYAKVSDFMEKRFPAFTSLIYQWERIVNEKGKKVKTLQQDLGEYETQVFAQFAKYITEKYGVTVFLLHDAIYISEKELSALPQNINEEMRSWFIQKLRYE